MTAPAASRRGARLHAMHAEIAADRYARKGPSAEHPGLFEAVSQPVAYSGSVGSRPSRGAPVPDEPMNSFRPSRKVRSRPLPLFEPSLAW